MTVYPCPTPLEATLAPLVGAGGFMLMAALLIWFTLWARAQFLITEYEEEEEPVLTLQEKLAATRARLAGVCIDCAGTIKAVKQRTCECDYVHDDHKTAAPDEQTKKGDKK